MWSFVRYAAAPASRARATSAAEFEPVSITVVCDEDAHALGGH